MGYTPGFEGPHPSQLPVVDLLADEVANRCQHNGCSDRWRGDDVTGPGYVWSCMIQCGAPGSQIYYPDGWENQMNSESTPDPVKGRVEARFYCDRKQVIDQSSVSVTLRASTSGRDNTEWAPYTPVGTTDMVVNGPAGAEFIQGERYRVTFERVGPNE